MEAEEWISEVEDRVMEITASEKNKEWKSWESETSDIKDTNIHITEVTEWE